MEKHDEFFYLNEVEKEELRKLAQNKTAMQALEKVMLEPIYFQGVLNPGEEAKPHHNVFVAQLTQPVMENAPNEEFGLYAKAMVNGLKFVQTGITKLGKFVPAPVETEKKKNKAR